MKEEDIDVGNKKAGAMLDRIVLRLKMKEKRLTNILETRVDMHPDIKSRIEKSIMGTKKKIHEISIANFEFKVLGILEGENK